VVDAARLVRHRPHHALLATRRGEQRRDQYFIMMNVRMLPVSRGHRQRSHIVQQKDYRP
jgi:hypothetical protein